MKQIVSFSGMYAFMAVLGVAVLFTACSKDSVKKEVFTGYAQKGPFAAGSSVTISELQADLTQTGKTYITTVSDNLGGFELTNIELVSSYVQVKVEGSYFHEFGGVVTPAPITLYTVVDIKNVSSANVNVLTHLEKQRVEYLVKQEKKNFSAAKKQAQQEVLAIFGFTPSNTSSEALDLTNDGMLLAISCIFVAFPYYGGLVDLMELMANISEDIKTDGVLNNTALGRKLVDCAIDICTDDGSVWYRLDRARTNMEARYPNVTIPDFESYIQSFANSNLY